ncbi:MAG: LysM peptidoglycan-binding domain-containing protein [Oscillospiraceae bacterium]|nr:LysM peptidoglycan-binding domain-containing protein [Oscillospiraceae bacterium]
MAQKFSFSTRYNTNFKEFYNIIGTDERDEYNFADAKNVLAAQRVWLDELPAVELNGYFELITRFDEEHREFVQEFCQKLTSFDMEKAYCEDYAKWKNYQTPEGVKTEFEAGEFAQEKQLEAIRHLQNNYVTSNFNFKSMFGFCGKNIMQIQDETQKNSVAGQMAGAIYEMAKKEHLAESSVMQKINSAFIDICEQILKCACKVDFEKFLSFFEIDSHVKKDVLMPLKNELENHKFKDMILGTTPQELFFAIQVYKKFIVVLAKKLEIEITVQSVGENAKNNVFIGLVKTFDSLPDIARDIIEMFSDASINSKGIEWFISEFDCAKDNLELRKFILHEVGNHIGWGKVFESIKNESWFEEFACEVFKKCKTNEERKSVSVIVSINFHADQGKIFFAQWYESDLSVQEKLDVIGILCESRCSSDIKKSVLVKIDEKLVPQGYSENQYKIAQAIQKTEWRGFCPNSKTIVDAEKNKEEIKIKIKAEEQEKENYLDLIVAYWISVYKKKMKLNELKKILNDAVKKDDIKKDELEKFFPDDRLQRILDKAKEEATKLTKYFPKKNTSLKPTGIEVISILVKKSSLNENFENYINTIIPGLIAPSKKAQKESKAEQKKTIQKKSPAEPKTKPIKEILTIIFAIILLAAVAILVFAAINMILTLSNGEPKNENNVEMQDDESKPQETEAEITEAEEKTENESGEEDTSDEKLDEQSKETEPQKGEDVLSDDIEPELVTFGYTIRTSETLSKIAERFGTSVAKIQQLNENIIDTDQIRSGDNIKIPTPEKYTAQKGETLSTIAAMFDIPIDTLKQINVDITDAELDISDQEIQILPLVSQIDPQDQINEEG